MSLNYVKQIISNKNTFQSIVFKYFWGSSRYFSIGSIVNRRLRRLPGGRVVVTHPTITKQSYAEATGDEPIQIDNPYKKEKKLCILCQMNITPNYKNVRLLSQFQSPYTGRIYGRHITGLCRKKHDQLTAEIIKSRSCGYMAVYHKGVEFLKDPRLFDPERPIRPHKY